jgi:hypothetical protein
VSDRESDMLELMVKARDMADPVDDLVRCQHNRMLPGRTGSCGRRRWRRVNCWAH